MKSVILLVIVGLIFMTTLPISAQKFNWEIENKKTLEIYKNEGYESSIPLASKLLEKSISYHGKNHLYTALSGYNLSCMYNDWGNHIRAKEITDEVLELLQKKSARQYEIALVLSNMGNIQFNLTNYSLAIKYYTQSNEILKELGDEYYYDHALSHYNLAMIHLKNSEFLKSEQWLLKSLQLFEEQQQTDHTGYATCLESLGYLYLIHLGQYEKSVEPIKKAYSIRQLKLSEEHLDFYASMASMAAVASIDKTIDDEFSDKINKGYENEYSPKLYDYYTLSPNNTNIVTGAFVPYILFAPIPRKYKLEVLEAEGEQESEEPVFDSQAQLDYENKVDSIYENMFGFDEETKMPKMFSKKFQKELKGNIDSLVNMYDAGEINYEESLQLVEQLTDQYAKRGIEESISDNYKTQINSIMRLQAHYLLTFGQREAFQNSPLITNMYKLMYANSEKVNGNFNNYYKVVNTYLEEMKQAFGALSMDYQIYLSNQVKECIGLGHFKKAEEYSLKGIYESLELYDTFDYMSESERRSFWGRPFWDDIQSQIDKYYRSMLDWSEEGFVDASQAYDLRLQTKSQLLNKSAKIKTEVLNSGNERLISKFKRWVEYRNKIAQLSMIDLVTNQSEINTLEEKANRLEKEISSESHVFDHLSNQEKVTWDQIRNRLNDNEAAIEILRIPEIEYDSLGSITNISVYYAALIITRFSKYPEVHFIGNGLDLEKRNAKAYRDYFITSDPKHDTNSPSKIIYDSYWSPIKNALPENITKAYLSPAGIYNSINLNTLYNEKYLIDEINLQYVSTTAVLLEPEANILEKDSRNISLIGNPSYHMSDEDYDIYVNRLTRDEEKRGGNIAKWLKRKVIPPLPATQVEVEEISQLFHQNQWKVTTYLRAEANEDNFKLLNNPTILHVATHGYFVGKEGLDQETGELNDYLNYSYQATDAMLKSGLLLAGVSNYYKSHDYPAIEDGLLTAYETTTLNLNNTDLVVLSACETGLGRIESGEGVYGLQRALKIAGANTLLMSLWKVSDQVTEELMVSFYHHLLESGDKRQAFEKAQKEIKEIYPQPHYWGAFIMLD